MQRRQFLTGALAIAAAASSVRFVSAAEFAAASTTKPVRFMNFTILSSGATIRAWNDNEFKKSFFADPTSVLRSFWGDKHKGLKIVLHENSRTVRHFPLPSRSELAATLTNEQLVDELKYETGSDSGLEHFLPPEVIAKALVDDGFKDKLIKAPNTTLAALGYKIPGVKIIVHANTDEVHHLTLPESPVDTVQLVSSEGKLRDYIVAVSSTCCASGTCDNMCASCHTSDTNHQQNDQNIDSSKNDTEKWNLLPRDEQQEQSRPLKEYLKNNDILTDV